MTERELDKVRLRDLFSEALELCQKHHSTFMAIADVTDDDVRDEKTSVVASSVIYNTGDVRIRALLETLMDIGMIPGQLVEQSHEMN